MVLSLPPLAEGVDAGGLADGLAAQDQEAARGVALLLPERPGDM